MVASTSSRGNNVLARLSPADLGLLQPHLQPVDLPLFTVLETGGQSIDTVYFIDRGIASVVASGKGKREIEVGIIGREGMSGLAVVLNQHRARHSTYIQVAGAGHSLSAAKLRQALLQSSGLQKTLLQCVADFLVQASETAVANGRSKTAERLARWLLMAHDRIDGDEIPLTHRLLAIMLGVQRPAATVAVQTLERKGLVVAGRRAITICNRKGLIKFSRGAYGGG